MRGGVDGWVDGWMGGCLFPEQGTEGWGCPQEPRVLPAGLVWGAGSCWTPAPAWSGAAGRCLSRAGATALLLWDPQGSHAGQGTAPIASPNAESALGVHGELSPSWPGSAPVLPAAHPAWRFGSVWSSACTPAPLPSPPSPLPLPPSPRLAPAPAVRSVSCATLAVSALCQACVCGSLTVNYNAL